MVLLFKIKINSKFISFIGLIMILDYGQELLAVKQKEEKDSSFMKLFLSLLIDHHRKIYLMLHFDIAKIYIAFFQLLRRKD